MLSHNITLNYPSGFFAKSATPTAAISGASVTANISVTGNTTFSSQIAVPAAGIKFSDNSTQTTAAASTSPGGSNQQVQFNNSGAFGGNSGFTFTGSALSLAFINGNVLTLTETDTDNVGRAMVNIKRGSTTVGEIATTNTTCSYNNVSDHRLKNNVKPMTGGLETVSKLQPVTYKWNDGNIDGQGFIAHELQAVIPDAVTGKKDSVDENGNPVYQSIDPRHIVATLTAAIQELNAKVIALEAKLESK
jgi:hypothetical protein